MKCKYEKKRKTKTHVLFIKSEFLQKQKSGWFRQLILQLGSNFLYSGKNSDFIDNNIESLNNKNFLLRAGAARSASKNNSLGCTVDFLHIYKKRNHIYSEYFIKK
jgi:hypothetical protein